MARMGLRRGMMIGVACVLTAAGMAEAGGKGNGGGKNNGGSKGYSSGGSYSGNHGHKNNGHKNNGHKNNGHHGSKHSGSSSSFSISIGSGYYGSGYSVGYGYSSGGWCAPRPRPYCGTYVAPACGPRYGYGYSYGYVRPSYICGPRYVVREYAPTYVVIDRPAPVQYIVSDASSATPTVISRPTPGYASNLGATDYRAWQIETELASRAAKADTGTMTASAPAAPAPHFAYIVETPQAERRPAGSVVVQARAPLPEATTVASR